MSGPDFDKTPARLKSEIDSGLEDLHRQLTASQGQSQRGHSSLLRGLLVTFVLLGQFVFTFLFDTPTVSAVPRPDIVSAKPNSFSYSERERNYVLSLLKRIDESADSIQTIKGRVAPNLQIDGSIGNIRSATQDTRQVLGLDRSAPLESNAVAPPASPLPIASESASSSK